MTARAFVRRPLRADTHSKGVLSVLVALCTIAGGGCGNDNNFFADSQWEPVQQFENSPVIFCSYSFSPDSKHFVSAGLDGKVRIHSAATGEVVAEWEGNNQKLYDACYSPSGKYILTDGISPPLQVWDSSTHKSIVRSAGEDLKLDRVKWSPDDRKIMAVSHKTFIGDIIVWDATTLKPLATIRGHEDQITGVEFSPKGDCIVSVGYDTTVRIWDAETFAPIKVLCEHHERIFAMAFAPDGKYLATGGLRGGLLDMAASKNLIIWDTQTWQPIYRLDNRYTVYGVDFSPDGRCLMTTDGWYVRWWNPANGKYLGKQARLGKEERPGYRMDSAVFSPDGNHAITLDCTNPENQVLHIWKRRGQK